VLGSQIKGNSECTPEHHKIEILLGCYLHNHDIEKGDCISIDSMIYYKN